MSFKNFQGNYFFMSESELNDKIKIQQNCQICGRPNGVMNFGAISCSACAAFFRRSMALSKSYKCKCQNGSKNEKAKFLFCKQCRLECCFEAGMKKERNLNWKKLSYFQVVRAISLRSFHEQRKADLLEKGQNAQLALLPMLTEGEGFLKSGVLKNLKEMSDKVGLIWFSAMPMPAQFWDCTLEELVHKNLNVLTWHKEFARFPATFVNKWNVLDEIEKHGLAQLWRDENKVCEYLRDNLTCIGIALTLPAIKMLDFADRIAQIRKSLPFAIKFLLPFYSLKLSTEYLVFPCGIGGIEYYDAARNHYKAESIAKLARKVFASPTSMYKKLMLDGCEFMLLMHMLLCTPTASCELSQKAREILAMESEKYGKMLLRYQQHHFGEQAGALRYMESLELIWNAIERAQRYRELMEYIDIVVHQGILQQETKILKSLNKR